MPEKTTSEEARERLEALATVIAGAAPFDEDRVRITTLKTGAADLRTLLAENAALSEAALDSRSDVENLLDLVSKVRSIASGWASQGVDARDFDKIKSLIDKACGPRLRARNRAALTQEPREQ